MSVSPQRSSVSHSVPRTEDGLRAVEWLGRLDLVLDPTTPRLRRIWAMRDRMSAYGAAYAAAAEAFGAPLVTVDRRLLGACHEAAVPARHLDELA